MEKQCNKDCTHFSSVSNTDECGLGICRYTYAWQEVKIGDRCKCLPKEYTCIDCDHFGNDYACLTAEENDKPCCGFVDAKESVIYNILYEWKLRGINIQDNLSRIVDEVNTDFIEL